MLFHSFSSQDERRKFGNGNFLQFVFCKLDRGSAVEEIVSNRAVVPLLWNHSSLYLCGDDWNEFCEAYGESSPEAPMKIWKRVIWIGAESTIFPRSKCSKSSNDSGKKNQRTTISF